jgi:hypothetical protein
MLTSPLNDTEKMAAKSIIFGHFFHIGSASGFTDGQLLTQQGNTEGVARSPPEEQARKSRSWSGVGSLGGAKSTPSSTAVFLPFCLCQKTGAVF